MQQIVSGFESAEVTSATLSALTPRLLAGTGWAGPTCRALKTIAAPLEGTAQSRAVSWHTASIAISGAASFTIAGLVGNW